LASGGGGRAAAATPAGVPARTPAHAARRGGHPAGAGAASRLGRSGGAAARRERGQTRCKVGRPGGRAAALHGERVQRGGRGEGRVRMVSRGN